MQQCLRCGGDQWSKAGRDRQGRQMHSCSACGRLCWPFGSSARSEGPVPSQGGIVITSETHVSKDGVQGYVHSFRGRMSQTASTGPAVDQKVSRAADQMISIAAPVLSAAAVNS